MSTVESPDTTTTTTSKDNVVDFTGKGATTSSSKRTDDADMERLKSELTCSICKELFVKAATLNCSHTFCRQCIDKWRENQERCPICRTKIKTGFPSNVVDRCIEKVLESSPDELIRKRSLELKSKKRNVTVPVHNSDNPTIDVSSDELSDDLSDDLSDESSDDLSDECSDGLSDETSDDLSDESLDDLSDESPVGLLDESPVGLLDESWTFG